MGLILSIMAVITAYGLARAIIGANRYRSSTRKHRMNLAAIAERYRQGDR